MDPTVEGPQGEGEKAVKEERIRHFVTPQFYVAAYLSTLGFAVELEPLPGNVRPGDERFRFHFEAPHKEGEPTFVDLVGAYHSKKAQGSFSVYADAVKNLKDRIYLERAASRGSKSTLTRHIGRERSIETIGPKSEVHAARNRTSKRPADPGRNTGEHRD